MNRVEQSTGETAGRPRKLLNFSGEEEGIFKYLENIPEALKIEAGQARFMI